MCVRVCLRACLCVCVVCGVVWCASVRAVCTAERQVCSMLYPSALLLGERKKAKRKMSSESVYQELKDIVLHYSVCVRFPSVTLIAVCLK